MNGVERIRLATIDDAAGVAAIYDPIVSATSISFEEFAPGPEEMGRRILATVRDYPWLVADGTEGIAGYAYAATHRSRAAYRWSVDVSAYVHERARGRGVATRLYALLFRILEAQGFCSAFAGITMPNDASLALHRAAGFADVGTYPDVGYKHGAWHDTRWLVRRIRPPAVAPLEPRALATYTEAEIAHIVSA